MVALVPAGRELKLERDPDQVVEDARRVASTLMRLVGENRRTYVMEIGQAQHLTLEAWQTIAAAYGCSVEVEWTHPIERDGRVWGYEARAVVRTSDGRVVGAAESMCARDEPAWAFRPTSVWRYVTKTGEVQDNPPASEMVWEVVGGKKRPKKVRETREEPVPEYQLRGMAQTRAMSRALRGAFSWVTVLAGFEPTPAEEVSPPPPSDSSQQAAPIRSAQAGRPQDDLLQRVKELRDELGWSDAQISAFMERLFAPGARWASLSDEQRQKLVEALDELVGIG